MPAIGYYNNALQTLNFRRALDIQGSSWGNRISWSGEPGAGQFCSFNFVNGHPAFCYYNSTAQDMRFIRANDSLGHSWGTPVIIDAQAKTGEYCKLEIINGNPAVAYYREQLEYVMYCRANDPNGESWDLPDAVYPVDQLGTQELSLIDAGGFPALIFFNQTNRMYFKRAEDENGSQWNTNPIVPDLSTVTGRYNSAINVNGNPAIAYYDVTNQNLKYVRASSADGSSWSTPVVIDATGNVGLYTSMALVDGNPAITYFDDTNDDLKFVRANDPEGLSWGVPVTVFSTGSTGRYPSLTYFEGVPVIVFQGEFPYPVLYIKALDAHGASWGTPEIIHNIGLSGEQNQIRTTQNQIGIGWYAPQDQSMYYSAGLLCVSPLAPELSTSASSVCQGEMVQLNASGNGNIIWYSDPEGNNIIAEGVSVNVTTEGQSTFYAAAASCGQISDLSALSIDVIPIYEFSQAINICSGQSFLVGSSEYFDSGNYQDILQSSLGCDSIVNTQLNVTEFPQAAVILNDLVITASPDNASYQWITCEGEIISGEINQTFQVTSPGSYAAIVSINGCADTSSCITVNVTALQGISDTGLKIFPNPAKQIIRFSDNNPHHWEIFNVDGKLILKEYSADINTELLANGLYFIKCTDFTGGYQRLLIYK
ncbi:MAG: T9SS type A sorting domain-containing protein [Bacteroidia bacterium]